MSTDEQGSKAPDDLSEQVYAPALSTPEPEHTEVHRRLSRPLEHLQDAVVILLTITLFGLAFMFLWRVWQEIVGSGDLQRAISDIIFVIITVELYRLSVHSVKYHRVDLNILVEVGVSAIIQKWSLKG